MTENLFLPQQPWLRMYIYHNSHGSGFVLPQQPWLRIYFYHNHGSGFIFTTTMAQDLKGKFCIIC
jgi:hypothetical protein